MTATTVGSICSREPKRRMHAEDNDEGRNALLLCVSSVCVRGALSGVCVLTSFWE
jgi:hypothetical protein